MVVARLLQWNDWLTQDASSPKHTADWRHPMVAWLIHSSLSSLIIVAFHDYLLLPTIHHWQNGKEDALLLPPLGTISLCPTTVTSPKYTAATKVAIFCLLYAVALLWIRLVSNPPGVHRYSVLYGFTWLCNAALWVGGGFGLATCRFRLATGFAIAVSIDQLLWYVDALGYFCFWAQTKLSKKPANKMFLIGVCQYLVWEETQWSAKITCTHHFWTIPILIYGANGKLDGGSYFMNIIIVSSYVLLSRWLIPFGLHPIVATKSNTKKRRFEKYMNVNLSHELWQDIKIGILRKQADCQSPRVYLQRLIVWWMLFNFGCFLFLKGMLEMLYGRWLVGTRDS